MAIMLRYKVLVPQPFLPKWQMMIQRMFNGPNKSQLQTFSREKSVCFLDQLVTQLGGKHLPAHMVETHIRKQH